MPANGFKQTDKAIIRFADVKANARRFYREAIGKDVNPDHCWADFLFQIATVDTSLVTKSPNAKRDAHARLMDEKGYDNYRLKTALSATVGGPTGGYLVPPDLRADLMRDVSEEAFVRPEALVLPMASQTLLLPLPDAQTATGTAGVPPFFGGIQMNWSAEATGIAETAEPMFRAKELRANELTGYALVSNPMMQDAAGLDAWLRRLFARSVAWFEDFAFLRGGGVGQPLGALNSGATLKVTRSAPTTVKYVDMAAMLADLLPSSYLHAAWYITVGAMVQVTQLIDASGKTAWVPNYPNQLDKTGEGNRSIGEVFGRPTYVTEKLPVLGTLGDVLLFDPTLYVIGDRQAITIDVSEHVRFTNYQTTWRIIERVDGRPWFDASIKLSDQATVVSPVVALN